MSVELNKTHYICDACGEMVSGFEYPCSFAKAVVQTNRSGFHFNFRMDICNKCLPDSYFKDPISREIPTRKIFMGFIDKIKTALKR